MQGIYFRIISGAFLLAPVTKAEAAKTNTSFLFLMGLNKCLYNNFCYYSYNR